MEVGHRYTPMGNCTVSILCRHAVEGLLSGFIGEGMQERDCAIELGLDCRLTGGRERDRAQFFRRRVIMHFLRGGKSRKEKRQNEDSLHHVGLRETSKAFRIPPILRCTADEAGGDLMWRNLAKSLIEHSWQTSSMSDLPCPRQLNVLANC